MDIKIDKNNQNRCHQARFLGSRYTIRLLSPGFRPDPVAGVYSAPSDFQAEFGTASRGKRKGENDKKRKRNEGRKRKKSKEKEERNAKELPDKMCPLPPLKPCRKSNTSGHIDLKLGGRFLCMSQNGLVIACLTAVYGIPGLNSTSKQFVCRKNHGDIQPWAQPAHFYCIA